MYRILNRAGRPAGIFRNFGTNKIAVLVYVYGVKTDTSLKMAEIADGSRVERPDGIVGAGSRVRVRAQDLSF